MPRAIRTLLSRHSGDDRLATHRSASVRVRIPAGAIAPFFPFRFTFLPLALFHSTSATSCSPRARTRRGREALASRRCSLHQIDCRTGRVESARGGAGGVGRGVAGRAVGNGLCSLYAAFRHSAGAPLPKCLLPRTSSPHAIAQSLPGCLSPRLFNYAVDDTACLNRKVSVALFQFRPRSPVTAMMTH